MFDVDFEVFERCEYFLNLLRQIRDIIELSIVG